MFWSCCFPVVWASGKYKTKSVGSCKSSFPVDSGTKTHILELEIWDVLPAHKSGVNFITENQPARKKIFLYWKYWINFTVRGMIWNGLSILSFCETTKENVKKVRIAMFGVYGQGWVFDHVGRIKVYIWSTQNLSFFLWLIHFISPGVSAACLPSNATGEEILIITW